MADYAFFEMAAVLLLLVLSRAGVVAIVIFIAILATKPNTRSIGLRIFLDGVVGILVTDIFVVIARANPAVVDHLPHAVQIVIMPLVWAFFRPSPASGCVET